MNAIAPKAGPAASYAGSSCVGTTLNKDFSCDTDGGLRMGYTEVKSVVQRLTFWQWFSYSSYDSGTVQISSLNADGAWSDWVSIGKSQVNVSDWSFMSIDLSEYAGQTVRIAFYHSAGRNKYNHASESHGWFVDDVKIVSGTPQFSGDFETGWNDWYADRGVWQVGTPGAGPAASYAGSACVGTTLNKDFSCDCLGGRRMSYTSTTDNAVKLII